MKRAGLFILHDGPFLRECEWLKRRVTEAVPGLPLPGAVAMDALPQLLEALAAQIKQCDLFVVAAEPRQYYKLKAQLLEALGLPARVSQSVAALQKKYPEDTVFPSGSTLFITPDARYNGFAMRCGRQHMLVLPLRMDLLESLRAKLTQYLSRAAGSRLIPMPARSVDALLSQMGGYSANGVPISPESIVPWNRPWENAFQTNYRAQELLRSLSGQGIACDLLLPRAWAGTADVLRRWGGGVVNPVFLEEKYGAGNDASTLIKRRMRAAGCAFCGMLTPPSADGTHALVALAGPGGYARMRRMDLHAGDNAAAMALELLTLLSEYRDARQVRAGAGRVARAVAAGLAALVAGTGLFAGSRRMDTTNAQEVSYVRLRAGDAVVLNSALLNEAVRVDSGAPTAVSALLTREEEPSIEEEQDAPEEAQDAPIEIKEDLAPIEQEMAEEPAEEPTEAPLIVSQAKPAARGTFSFTVSGYGHGVGMSQEGAKALAAQGWSCESILKHYYPGAALANDAGTPVYVKHAGVNCELKEYLARVACAEIGRCGLVADEAVKAQMICVYTMAKRKNFSTKDADQVLLPAADWNSGYTRQFHTKMLELAGSVLGQYVSFNGAAAETLYFASCAGYTASAQYAWGGAAPAAYLAGGCASPETVSRSYPAFTSEQIKELVKAYNAKYPSRAITLGADASQWIQVLRADANGYVEQLRIGDRTFTGGDARMQFFGARNLRSHNFTVSFTAE